MNPKGIALAVLGGVGLIYWQRKRAPSAPAAPSPAVPAPVPVVTPATSSAPKPPKPKPTTSPFGTPPPPAISVPLPLGWRRLAEGEVTPALDDVRRQIAQAGFVPGTFNPFDLEGKSYAALVERDGDAHVTVALAVDEGLKGNK